MIVDLKYAGQRDEIELGGKAINLGKLIQKDFPVPEGFVVTTEAYSLFLENNNLVELINSKVSKIDYSNYDTIENCSRKIQGAIEKGTLPIELIEKIKEALSSSNNLGKKARERIKTHFSLEKRKTELLQSIASLGL